MLGEVDADGAVRGCQQHHRGCNQFRQVPLPHHVAGPAGDHAHATEIGALPGAHRSSKPPPLWKGQGGPAARRILDAALVPAKAHHFGTGAEAHNEELPFWYPQGVHGDLVWDLTHNELVRGQANDHCAPVVFGEAQHHEQSLWRT